MSLSIIILKRSSIILTGFAVRLVNYRELKLYKFIKRINLKYIKSILYLSRNNMKSLSYPTTLHTPYKIYSCFILIGT